MRIERLITHNYRQWKDLDLSLDKRGDRDLHVFVGENTYGKTNLLNAITYCLYGTEFHLSIDNGGKGEPPLNRGSRQALSDGEETSLWVEILVRGNGPALRFRRETWFRKHGEAVHKQRSRFIVTRHTASGNAVLDEGPGAEAIAERFVPKALKDFFVFDGERLTTYFDQAHRERIKAEVQQMARIDLLSLASDHLSTVTKTIERELGKANPDIELARAEKDKADELLANCVAEIETIQSQIVSAESELHELREQLKGIPNVADLERQREDLKKKIESGRAELEVRLTEKFGLLVEQRVLVGLGVPRARTEKLIKEKEDIGEIPPSVNVEVLDRALAAGVCEICGQHLSSESIQRIKKLIGRNSVISVVGAQLHRIKPSLAVHNERLGQIQLRLFELREGIAQYSRDIADAEKTISDIDARVSALEGMRVRVERRDGLETALKDNQLRLGMALERKVGCEARAKRAAEAFGQVLSTLDDAVKLRALVSFAARAQKILDRIKEGIMLEVRGKIEKSINYWFFKLISRRQSYREVTIGDDYSLRLIGLDGSDCLNTVAASEKKLLALAFTLALHSVSGFNAPLIIDTPVAETSGDQRRNFAKALVEVSQDKQVVLLFTPVEYSTEVSSEMDGMGTKRSIELNADEIASGVEVLSNG